MSKPRLLVCDDDPIYRDALKAALSGEYEVTLAANGDEALEFATRVTPDACLLDIRMRTQSEGLDVLPRLKRVAPSTPVIITSGLVDFHSVLRAMRCGATDYLPKGGGLGELRALLGRVLARQAEAPPVSGPGRHVLVGKSPKIESLRQLIERARPLALNTVVTGEPGSGKEVVARMLGAVLRNGAPAPFLSLDSATIHPNTAESTLFGHEKGAFTGAERTRKGLFEEADGGTVYFDEIANMSLDIQAKLLRVIQEKEVTRLGSSKAIPVSFRVVCATNRRIEELIASGEFRFDLYSRLSVLTIDVPPLRDRTEDIPMLIAHFCGIFEQNGEAITFTPDALELLLRYPWPGNIRELGNLVQYLCAMHGGMRVGPELLPLKIRRPDPSLQPVSPATDDSFYDQVESFQKTLLKRAYDQHHGNVSHIARSLKMDRSYLHAKLKKYGIHEAGDSRREQ